MNESIYRVYDNEGTLKMRGSLGRIAERCGAGKALIGMCAKEHKTLRDKYTIVREDEDDSEM